MVRVGDFAGDVRVSGDLQIGGSLKPDLVRDSLAQEVGTFPVDLTALRVFDAFQTVLPGTAASDDLALIGGTFGTAAPSVQTSDSKNTSVTQRARFLLRLPAEYDAGETVTIRISGGMITTVASSSATVDVEAYVSGRDATIDGSDLCTTAATTINSLTFGEKDFQITGTGLSPGDVLDIRLTIAITDSATPTAVIGCIGAVDLLCDIRG